jgi:hypothetical protein
VKGHTIPYSAAEMAWLEENRLLPISDYHAAFSDAFGRSDVSASNLHALRKRKGWKTGRTGCFEEGHVPHNKGKLCPEGTGGRHPNSRRTQFRKGGEPHNTKFLGHERVSKDGYLEISIADTNPHTEFCRRYVLKHKYVWEQANGQLPEGMALKCLDGNRLNTDPSNWELVPRAVLPRLNGGRFKNRIAYDQAHPDVKPVVMAIAKLEQRASERRARTA